MKSEAVNGRYAIYKGEKYEFDKDSDGQCYLISESLKDGFYKDDEKYYRKNVKKEEVDSIYVVNTFCKYKGYDFQIINELLGDKYLIMTSNPKTYEDEQLGLRETGRGEYIKVVEKNEVAEIKPKITEIFKNEEIKVKNSLPGDSKDEIAEELKIMVLFGESRKPKLAYRKKETPKKLDSRGLI